MCTKSTHNTTEYWNKKGKNTDCIKMVLLLVNESVSVSEAERQDDNILKLESAFMANHYKVNVSISKVPENGEHGVKSENSVSDDFSKIESFSKINPLLVDMCTTSYIVNNW